MLEHKKQDKATIHPESVFTIGTAVVLTIDEVNAVVRRALHEVNGKHVKTFAFYYHNGKTENADRHFHIAFTRNLRQVERDAITLQVEYFCKKNNWGRIAFLTRWGVTGHNSKNREVESVVAYLGEHRHTVFRNIKR